MFTFFNSVRLSSTDKFPVVFNLRQTSLIDRRAEVLTKLNKHSWRAGLSLEHFFFDVAVNL